MQKCQASSNSLGMHRGLRAARGQLQDAGVSSRDALKRVINSAARGADATAKVWGPGKPFLCKSRCSVALWCSVRIGGPSSQLPCVASGEIWGPPVPVPGILIV